MFSGGFLGGCQCFLVVFWVVVSVFWWFFGWLSVFSGGFLGGC